MADLSPDQVQKIHQLLHDKQVINAIKLYREATGTSLAEAKRAVEVTDTFSTIHSIALVRPNWSSSAGRSAWEIARTSWIARETVSSISSNC